MCNNGLNVGAVITDNHSGNVSAFNVAKKRHETDSTGLFIKPLTTIRHTFRIMFIL